MKTKIETNKCPYHTEQGRCEYTTPEGWHISNGCIYDKLIYTHFLNGDCQVKLTLDRILLEDSRIVK